MQQQQQQQLSSQSLPPRTSGRGEEVTL